MTSFFMDGPETSRRAAVDDVKTPAALFGMPREISQRIDVFADPVLSHLMQCHVRREIRVDDDANHRVGGLHDFWRGEKANSVGQPVNPNEAGDVVAAGLQSIGIEFCRLIEKPAEQGGSGVPLRREPLRSGLRVLRHP